jgi:hypothetical protein
MTVNLAGHANRIAALEAAVARKVERIKLQGGMTKADRDKPPDTIVTVNEGGVRNSIAAPSSLGLVASFSGSHCHTTRGGHESLSTRISRSETAHIAAAAGARHE